MDGLLQTWTVWESNGELDLNIPQLGDSWDRHPSFTARNTTKFKTSAFFVLVERGYDGHCDVGKYTATSACSTDETPTGKVWRQLRCVSRHCASWTRLQHRTAAWQSTNRMRLSDVMCAMPCNSGSRLQRAIKRGRLRTRPLNFIAVYGWQISTCLQLKPRSTTDRARHTELNTSWVTQGGQSRKIS